MPDYNLIVIGSGPAGFSCAIQAAKLNKQVLMIEEKKEQVGGTWIHTGTIPGKSMREAAKTILEFNTHFNELTDYKPHEHYKMADLLQYQKDIVEQENKKVQEDLANNNIELKRGTASFVDKNTVEVVTPAGETETYTADFILIATGCSPAEPENFEVDHKNVLNYKSLMELKHIPGRLVIIGWGVHGMEYATTFGALGTRVSVLSEKMDDLPFLDREISETFAENHAENINIRNEVSIEDVKFNSLRNSTEVHFTASAEPDRTQVLETEYILWLGGRQSNIDALNLDKVDVNIDKESYENFITTNDKYQSTVDNIYAAGDVIGFPMLASASFTQGRLAACNMFGIPFAQGPDKYPYAIYTIPEMAHVGITEEEAKNADLDYSVGHATFKEVAKANMINQSKGFLKIIFDTQSLQLLGVHIIGKSAANLIHLGQSVMAHNGTIHYFIQYAMNYPTLSEAYRIAAFNGLNKIYNDGVSYETVLKTKKT